MPIIFDDSQTNKRSIWEKIHQKKIHQLCAEAWKERSHLEEIMVYLGSAFFAYTDYSIREFFPSAVLGLVKKGRLC